MEVEDLFDWNGEQKVQTGFCRKIKFADKGANLECLGRYLKLFTEKVEHSGIVEHLDLSHLSESQLEEIEKIVESADPNAERHRD